jgi:hypothetical protein
MNGSVQQTYIAGVEAARVPIVETLDRAIQRAGADFDVAIKYRILMYTLDADWRHWVVSIDAHPKRGVALRFLNGTKLDDPGHLLRPGSSTLMTLDFASLGEVDTGLVTDYVRDAVAKHPDFVAAG